MGAVRVTGANHSECGDRFTVRASTELLLRVPRVCTAPYVSWESVASKNGWLVNIIYRIAPLARRGVEK